MGKPWAEEEMVREQTDPATEPVEKLGFRQTLAVLPRVLMAEVLKRFGAALLILLLAVAMLFLSKDAMYSIGFILALVFAYLGLDIIWKYGDNKILVARMIVCKANRSIRQRDRFHVILRDASIQDLVGQDYETYKYDLTVAARDRDAISAGTILDVYISENAPHAILAYEILGEAGK